MVKDIVTGTQANEEDLALTRFALSYGVNIAALRGNLGGEKGYTLESFVDDHLLPAMRESVLKKLREELGE